VKKFKKHKNNCPQCNSCYTIVSTDIIFYDEFTFIDCQSCDYIGVWGDGEWLDSRMVHTYDFSKELQAHKNS
jgi:hypothetical protein